MGDILKNNKLYGIGHNFQKKYKYPTGMLDCFVPPKQSKRKMTDKVERESL